jgi:putative DNA primase/helicase
MADIIRLDFEETSTEPKGKPSVHVEAGVRKETADAVEQALLNSNCDLFVRGGLIVRIDYLKMKTWDEKDVEIQTVVECGDAFVTETIADVCTFIKYDERKRGDRRCNPPNWISSTLRQRMSRLTLPVLNGVCNCPIMRFNGELITEPGYHKETGLYFDPRGVKFPTIPEAPTKDDAQRALDRLKVLFHTFPFVGKGSRSVALSALLTTVARRAVDFAPMHTFNSPTAGTGKSLLTDIISIVATGDRAAVLAMTEDSQEFDKLLSAELMRGRSLIAIDNCNVPLKSTVLPTDDRTSHTRQIRIGAG